MSTTALQPQSSLADSVLGNRNGNTVQVAIDALALQLAGSGFIPAEMIYTATWPALLAIAGTKTGQGAEVVESDAGTHAAATATGYNGEVVPNAGRYTWSQAWGRWVRIGSSGVASVLAAMAEKVGSGEYETTETGTTWMFTDEVGRILFSSKDLEKPGILAEIYETTDSVDGVYFVDETGRVISFVNNSGSSAETGPPKELVTARGNLPTLVDRLNVSTDADGYPIDWHWGSWYLRETRMRLRALKRGDAMKFGIAILGDSWSHSPQRYSGPLAETLVGEYGGFSSGWIGFGYPDTRTQLRNGSVLTSVYTLTVPIGWTPTYADADTPDIALLTTTNAGATIQVSGPDNGDTTFTLYYLGTADGVVRYRWNGGAWTNLPLPNTSPADNVGTIALTGTPAGAWTLNIESVSGTVSLCGMVCSRAGNGVVVHKLAATGSRLAQWTARDATKWKAAFTALGEVNLTIMMFGTNDQRSTFIGDFTTQINEQIDRLRAVNPAMDILLMAPCENGRTDNPRPMSQYTKVIRATARTKRCAYIDFQPLFGENVADYMPTGIRPWFNVDLLHPEPPTGGRALTDAVLRMLTQM